MNQVPPYAPIKGYNFPTNDLDKEITLADDAVSREVHESLSEIYSIIVALDLIEKSYLNDSLVSNDPNNDYTSTVLRLLNQYTSLLKVEETRQQFVDLQTFKDTYKIRCPLATRRISVGVPATMETSLEDNAKSSNNGSSAGVSSRAVAEVIGNFITLMDALKLNYKAKSQLYPLLAELLPGIREVLGSESDSDSEASGSDAESVSQNENDLKRMSELVKWLVKLNNMDEDDSLTTEESSQFLDDLVVSYKEFYTRLE